MNDSFLLHEEDMLKETHSPVIGFFSVISNPARFVRIINTLSTGVGHGFEFAVCTFPGDLDEYDIAQGMMFDGVEFSLHSGEEVVISYEEFYYYLHKACMNHLEIYPEDKTVIGEILERVRKRYDIKGE